MASGSEKMVVSKRAAMRNFNDLMRAADKVILARFDRNFSLQVHEKARQQFENLINDIPYVGGRKNSFSGMLINSAVILALYRALKNEEVSLEEFGKILEEITIAYMNSFPAWVRKLAGKLWMSRLFNRLLMKQSKISQQRNYEGDFVFEVVPGEDGYKWGINYIECGIVKFLHKQGEVELAKQACILDYLMFPAIGVDLKRTGTIAQGCKQCDFRFG